MSVERALGEWGHKDAYNLSPADMDLVRRRSERRVLLKQEFHRILYNPYAGLKAEGGVPFDPALQRFASTRADYYPYFRPNKRNFGMFICMYWLPLGLFIYYGWNVKENYEKRLRNAEIPWRFRSIKIIG